MDFDDCWDSLVQVEEESYKEGFEEGRAAAKTSGIREDGQRGGFLKGLAYGLELGFVEQYAVQSLGPNINSGVEKVDSDPMSPTEHSPPTSSPRTSNPAQQRNEKRLREIIQTISKIPQNNQHSGEIDFDKEIQHLRSLYRQAGAPLGPFPPSTTHSTEPKKEVVTHEW